MTIQYDPTQRCNALDEFLTPQALVDAAVRLVARHADKEDELLVLDPGANMGIWGRTVRKYFPNAYIYGVEYMHMPEEAAVGYDIYLDGTDFLSWESPLQFDLIIGNPPYSIRVNGKREIVAEKFVRKGLSLLSENAYLYFLLRSGFRHSRERYWQDKKRRQIPGIHQTHHYMECWACTPRPSFYREDVRTEQHGLTKTNAHEYDLFVWHSLWNYLFGHALELDWDY